MGVRSYRQQDSEKKKTSFQWRRPPPNARCGRGRSGWYPDLLNPDGTTGRGQGRSSGCGAHKSKYKNGFVGVRITRVGMLKTEDETEVP